MPRPGPKDILQQLEDRRKEGGLWQSDRDYQAQERWIVEGCKKRGAKIQYLPSVTVRKAQRAEPLSKGSGVDKLYGDILDPQFLESLSRDNLSCYVEHNPSKQRLKKYSIDEEKEVIFHIPLKLLADAKLVTEKRFRGADIGDLVVWDGTWYIVDAVHRGSFFGQRINHYFTAAICSRYRLNNVPTEFKSSDECGETTTGLGS